MTDQLDLDRLEQTLTPCGTCKTLGFLILDGPPETTETCPACNGAGERDTNPDTAPIPY